MLNRKQRLTREGPSKKLHDMAFRRRHTVSEVPTTASRYPVTSRLLPQVFANIDQRKSIQVLDLGGGSAQTVAFFSSLPAKSRIIFADTLELVDVRLNTLEDEEVDFSQAVEAWRQHLGLSPADKIDYLLLWDYLHYFKPAAVEALSSALLPHIHQETKGYGFGSLHSDMPMPGGTYALDTEETLLIKQSPEPLLYSHSQQVIADHFMCMRISRGTLLREGHLELLFEA